MKRELLLLRHGKSDWDAESDDFCRPLKERGKKNAQRMGLWMVQQNSLPDRVISSPAYRARNTAEKTCKAMGIHSSHIHQDMRIYEASLEDLLAVIRETPGDTQRLLLIGHNPGLEHLLIHLVPDIQVAEDGKLMPTATLAHLEFEGDWHTIDTDAATLRSVTRPRSLPKTFPFPGPDGTEMRDRPAYYYTQSAVIPYRVSDGQLEILLVSSSSNKHWVIPKGIKDQALTAQESAAREAEEEAGVLGDVSDLAIGQYGYSKWGATCSVDVFPMEVTEMLADEDWEESHRERQWLSPEKAADLLKQKEVSDMVKQLASRIQAA